MKQLLLISSYYSGNGGYLEHCESVLKSFLGPPDNKKPILFIPYAAGDWDVSAKKAIAKFSKLGYRMKSIHEYALPKEAFSGRVKFSAIVVGGGNVFRLRYYLKHFHHDITEIVKENINDGTLRYVGIHAGSVMACPTIKTVIDMPALLPPDFNGFDFIDFQLNPRFVSSSQASIGMQESCEECIRDYHWNNDLPVVGLPEANWLTLKNEDCVMYGPDPALIFKKGKNPVWWSNRENGTLKR